MHQPERQTLLTQNVGLFSVALNLIGRLHLAGCGKASGGNLRPLRPFAVSNDRPKSLSYDFRRVG